MNFSDALSAVVNYRTVLKWEPELKLISESAYFGLTTWSGLQTLGEEYCAINPSSSSKHLKMSTRTKALLWAFTVLGPYLFRKYFHKKYKLWVRNSNYQTVFPENLDGIASFLDHFHFTTFLIFGVFRDYGRRILGLRYFYSEGSKPYHSITYKLIG